MKSKDILSDLIQGIVCGEFEENSKFPSEAQLSEEYSCNRHTIRKVIETLIERGYLRKIHGGPSFVNPIPSSYSLNLSSFYDLYLAREIRTKVQSFNKITADEDICQKLNIEGNSKVWFITRLRCVGNEVDHIEYIYMPVSLFNDLTKKDCEASLLTYIENLYEISHGVKTITGIRLTKEEMDLANKTDNLALQVENVGYLTNGRVYEYSLNKHFNNEMIYHAKR